MTKNKISDVCPQFIEVFGRNRSRKMIVKFVLCALFLRSVSGEWLPLKYESDDSVTRVIERLFGINETVCIITDGIMSDVEFDIPNPKIIWNLNATQKLGKQQTVYNFIIQVNDSNSLGNALKQLKESPAWYTESTPSGTFLIIISEIDKVFENLWMYPITNSVILVNGNGLRSSKCKLYQSIKWSVKNECGKRPNDIYEEDCQDGPTLIFKKGFRSYHGCPIGTSMDWIGGSIHSSLIEVRERYSVAFVSGDDVGYCLSAYVNTKRITSAILTSHYIWLMPLPKEVPPLKLYLIIFQEEVWIMVAVGFLLTIFFYVIISLWKRIPVNLSTFGFIIMEILSLTFWGSCSRIPNVTSLRVLLLSYIFYAIVVQTGYVSNLIRVQTIPQFEPGIDSIRQLIKSNVTIYANILTFASLGFNKLNFLLMNELNKEIVFPDLFKFADMIDSVVVGSNHAAVIMGYFDVVSMIEKYKSVHNKVIFDDSFLRPIEYCLCVSPKDHYFFDILNKVTTGQTENGFYSRARVQDCALIKNATESFKYPTDPQVLKLDHVYGIFVIWGFCLCISFLVLILEIIVHKLQVCKSNTIKPITVTVEEEEEEEVEIIDIEYTA